MAATIAHEARFRGQNRPPKPPMDEDRAVTPARAPGVTRNEVLVVAGLSAVVWLLFSSTWPLLPVRWFVTLVHEAGHAGMVEAVGGDVGSVTINPRGGGLTTWRARVDLSTTRRLLVASSGYVGAAIVGGFMLEMSTRLRRGRIAAAGLAIVVAAIGLAWVPWRINPAGAAAIASGSSRGDGRFTVAFCVAAVVALAALAIQPAVRLRRAVVVGLATALCLASVDDLRRVLAISTRGGHSDAATAAAITALPSWAWAALWLVCGVAACALGVWAALGRGRPDDRSEVAATGDRSVGSGDQN